MFKNTHIWLPSYIKQRASRAWRKPKTEGPVHVIFCFVDHFEPEWKGAGNELQAERVDAWVKKYPILTAMHRDADGRAPQHTFFYPVEVYVKKHLDSLTRLTRAGLGEVEVHLHHDNDMPETLRLKLEKAKVDLTSHGFLGKDRRTGKIRYAFIHGNWALNNSRRDGRWCGVNDESRVLRESGCYADFTFPSAPSETQPRKINSIYYDIGNGQKPRSHDAGMDVFAGQDPYEALMLIQGPLTLNWGRRSRGIFPRIENGDITGANPPSGQRADLWVEQRIGVAGRPEWVFVKVHTHGAQDNNRPVLLGPATDQLYTYLEKKYNDGQNYVLHYVTAREMYNIVKAAEAGRAGNPGEYRDYEVIKYSVPDSRP